MISLRPMYLGRDMVLYAEFFQTDSLAAAMIATRNPSGQIIFTPEGNEASPIPEAAHYDVAVSTSGNIMLRPRRKHQRSLVEHFAAMKGLEIAHRIDPIPEPPKL